MVDPPSTSPVPSYEQLYLAQTRELYAHGVVRVSDITPEPVGWLWPDRIPLGKITVLEGDPGLGKSTILLDLAARLTTARPMPPDDATASLSPPLPPSPVVLLTAEDAVADTIRPRLEAAEANIRIVVVLSHMPSTLGHSLPQIPRDGHFIEAVVERIGAKLVVIDPLVAYLGRGVSAYRDQDLRRALTPLAHLAEKTGAAVVAVRHLSKMPSRNPLYRGGGSIGILGAARSALLVGRDPDDPSEARRLIVPYKSNLGALASAIAYRLVAAPNGAPRVLWEGSTNHSPADLLASPADQQQRDIQAEAVAILRSILADGPVPASTVVQQAREAGLGRKTLLTAKAHLSVRSQKLGRPAEGDQGWVWVLPGSASN